MIVRGAGGYAERAELVRRIAMYTLMLAHFEHDRAGDVILEIIHEMEDRVREIDRAPTANLRFTDMT